MASKRSARKDTQQPPVIDSNAVEEAKQRRSSIEPRFFATTVSTSSSLRAADFKQDDPKEQETLIRILLQGYSVERSDGRQDLHYWKPRSDDENIARKALADVLRSGRSLSQYTLDLLAALFDPQSDQHPAIKRRIKFEERRPGAKQNNFNDTLVAKHIYNLVKEGTSVECSIGSAAERFKLGHDRVKTIWLRYHAQLKAIQGPLVRSRRRRTRP